MKRNASPSADGRLTNFSSFEIKENVVEPGKFKTVKAQRSECNVTAKEIDGEIYLCKKYTEYSIATYERLIKLQKHSEDPRVFSLRPQRNLFPIDCATKSKGADIDDRCEFDTALPSTSTEIHDVLKSADTKSNGKPNNTPSYWFFLSYFLFIPRMLLNHLKTASLSTWLLLAGCVIALCCTSSHLYKPRTFAYKNMDMIIYREMLDLLEERVFGQHMVTNLLPVDYSISVADPAVKISFFLFIGSSGTGKSLTSHILKEDLKHKGFIVFERQLTGNRVPNLVDVCQMLSNGDSSQKIVLILEDVDQLSFIGQRNFTEVIAQACSAFRKVIFLVTSTVFSFEIQDFVQKNYMLGKNREDMKYEDLILSLANTSVNLTNLGEIHAHNLVKYSVFPFLPLEMKHVRMCLKMELIRRKVSKEHWNKFIIKSIELMYYTNHNGMYLSESGCKLAKSRLDYVLNQ
eukprot:gene6556-7300_t